MFSFIKILEFVYFFVKIKFLQLKDVQDLCFTIPRICNNNLEYLMRAFKLAVE